MSNIKLFEDKKVRSHWDAENEIWYFSVIDIIEILTGSSIPKRYWSDLKKKLTKEGSQLYEKIVQLKFEAVDGKKYATDCLDTPNLLRLIQSIPSPKAEPFKTWAMKLLTQSRYHPICINIHFFRRRNWRQAWHTHDLS